MFTSTRIWNLISNLLTSLVIFTLAFVAFPANADTIVSINLDRQTSADPDANTDRIPAASAVGVVNAANWNNTDIQTSYGGPHAGFVDSNAGAVAGLSFTLTGGGSDSWNTGGHIPARMMGDWANNINTLTISDIPTNGGVSLITYHGGFNGGGNNDNNPAAGNTANVTANGDMKTYDDSQWDNQEFDNAGSWAYTENENYLRWDFVGDTNAITADFQSVIGGRALNAFQLVLRDAPTTAEVPEPASLAIWSILGLCLAGYGYRRRRRNG